jgi:hypothetical protein
MTDKICSKYFEIKKERAENEYFSVINTVYRCVISLSESEEYLGL